MTLNEDVTPCNQYLLEFDYWFGDSPGVPAPLGEVRDFTVGFFNSLYTPPTPIHGETFSVTNTGDWVHVSHVVNYPAGVPASSFIEFKFANGGLYAMIDNISLLPTPFTLGPDIDACPGDPVVLDAGDCWASYAWSTSATSQTISPTTAGNYSVTVTDALGNTFSDDVNVSFYTVAPFDLGPDISVCAAVGATLDAGTGWSIYAWNTGATTPTLTVSTTGTYSCTVTDVNGCSANDDLVVTLHPDPAPDLGPDLTSCTGSPVTLNVLNGPFSSYAWSTGATTSSISVTGVGTYEVTVTDANGCTGTDAIDVTNLPPMSADFSNSITGINCLGDLVNFSDLSTGTVSSWAWDFGD
ncbi:MAG: hypothetical protein AAF570_28665, partial [Bacteroidota bacterium]